MKWKNERIREIDDIVQLYLSRISNFFLPFLRLLCIPRSLSFFIFGVSFIFKYVMLFNANGFQIEKAFRVRMKNAQTNAR
jgi:hypothetical protein